jgi:hypothetical protein
MTLSFSIAVSSITHRVKHDRVTKSSGHPVIRDMSGRVGFEHDP